jgi:hypothetical protein
LKEEIATILLRSERDSRKLTLCCGALEQALENTSKCLDLAILIEEKNARQASWKLSRIQNQSCSQHMADLVIAQTKLKKLDKTKTFVDATKIKAQQEHLLLTTALTKIANFEQLQFQILFPHYFSLKEIQASNHLLNQSRFAAQKMSRQSVE